MFIVFLSRLISTNQAFIMMPSLQIASFTPFVAMRKIVTDSFAQRRIVRIQMNGSTRKVSHYNPDIMTVSLVPQKWRILTAKAQNRLCYPDIPPPPGGKPWGLSGGKRGAESWGN